MHLGEISKFGCPVVWTLHDAWPFTGGCHYPGECNRFRSGCGTCPQLGSTYSHDLSYWNLRAKRSHTAAVDHWISPSKWLGKLAVSGGICTANQMSIVPNGVDGGVFRPNEYSPLRRKLNLESDVLILVAGAADLTEPRKGARLLPAVLQKIRQTINRKFVLVTFGGKSRESAGIDGEGIVSLGQLPREDMIVDVLSGSDLLLMPSLQDNLPNIAVEAQACGCPVVGFDSGGLNEIVESGSTGLLAPLCAPGDLAEAAISWFRSAPARSEVTKRCRVRYESLYSFPAHAVRLTKLYTDLLSRSCGPI